MNDAELEQKISEICKGIDDDALSANDPLEALVGDGYLGDGDDIFGYNDVVVKVAGDTLPREAEKEIGEKVQRVQARGKSLLERTWQISKAIGFLEGCTQITDATKRKIEAQTERVDALEADVALTAGSRDGWKSTAEGFQETAIRRGTELDELQKELDDTRAALQQREGQILEMADRIADGTKENTRIAEQAQEMRYSLHKIEQEVARESSAHTNEKARLTEEIHRLNKLAEHYEGLADRRLIRRIGRGLWTVVQKIDDQHSPN